MGIFIKRSDIADTLGLTSVLLIDKSTILASNKMQLTKIWHNKQLHSIDQHFSKENAESQTLNDILNVISVCNRTQALDRNLSFDRIPKSEHKVIIISKLELLFLC